MAYKLMFIVQYIPNDNTKKIPQTIYNYNQYSIQYMSLKLTNYRIRKRYLKPFGTSLINIKQSLLK